MGFLKHLILKVQSMSTGQIGDPITQCRFLFRWMRDLADLGEKRPKSRGL